MIKHVRWRTQATHRRKRHPVKKILTLLIGAGKAWMDDNAMRLSAALSLYTILSLAPLLVITIKILDWIVPGKEFAQENVSRQITMLLGSQAAGDVQPIIASTTHHGYSVGSTAISTLVLLFSATGAFIELQDSMHTIWGKTTKPNKRIWAFVRNRLLSLGMVLGVGFMSLLSVFVTRVLTGAADFIPHQRTGHFLLINVLFPFGVVLMLFAAIFKFLPDVTIQWKHVWPGALIGAILFTAGKYALQIYLEHSAGYSIYGAAGSLSAVLLWVYYSAFSLFYGAEFTKVSARGLKIKDCPA